MFPRGKRLSRTHFSAALLGRRLSSKNFTVVIPHHGEGYAVVVGKKAAKLSVERHLVKRRVLAILRTLTLPPALVVYPKTTATGLLFKELRSELTELLGKISR